MSTFCMKNARQRTHPITIPIWDFLTVRNFPFVFILNLLDYRIHLLFLTTLNSQAIFSVLCLFHMRAHKLIEERYIYFLCFWVKWFHFTPLFFILGDLQSSLPPSSLHKIRFPFINVLLKVRASNLGKILLLESDL